MASQTMEGEAQCDAFTRAFAAQNEHFETALQCLDSLSAPLPLGPGAGQWLALVRPLLRDAAARLRQLLARNAALAARIDDDLHRARQQVSSLRAELAETNQRIREICASQNPPDKMAGNVITTCMPPTATTTTAVNSMADCHWTPDLAQGPSPLCFKESNAKVVIPPAADRGGTTDLLGQKQDCAKTEVVSSEPTNSHKQYKSHQVPTAGYSMIHQSEVKSETVSSESSEWEYKNHQVLKPPVSHQDKSDSLTESSEASEECKPIGKAQRRERRSLKGSDIQRSLLHEAGKSQGDGFKAELESDHNQNSAPECDLSLGKDDGSSAIQKPEVIPDAHRNSPPVKDDTRAFPFRVELPDSVRYSNRKTNSDPLDKRRDISRCIQEHLVLSTPGSVTKLKPGSAIFKDQQWQGASWLKPPSTSKYEDSSSKEETSDSQDALTPSRDDCPSRPLLYESHNARRPYRDWRTSLSETYRDHQSSADPWRSGNSCDTKELSDMSKYEEKGYGKDPGLIHDKAYFRKSDTFDCPSFGTSQVAPEDATRTQLVREVEALKIRNSALLRDLEEVMESRDDKSKENAILASKMDQTEKELKHAKEALSALKQDRKRLKAEKFDLLTQMKQLYGTLEDKEEELREFIRNFERKVKEGDDALKQLTKEREDQEQEKWNILKRARDEAERAVLLCTQVGLKDARIKELQDEMHVLQERLHASGDGGHTNGYGSPGSVSYRTANGIDSRGTTTPTPGSDPTTSPSYAGTPTTAGPYEDSVSPMKGPLSQGLSPDHRQPLMSRSAEDIFNSAVSGSACKKKAKEKKGTWGSISRVFSRNKSRRKALDPDFFQEHRSSWSPNESPLSEENRAQQLRHLEEARTTPMQHWRAATVRAWLELAMDMPQYGTRCADNVRSGKVLLELSDSELEQGLGITNVMHRRKLRLAIEEHRQPSLCRYPKLCQLTHAWVLEEWLPSLALSCYTPSFAEHLVDGRVLDTLTKKDLERHLGITRKLHQLSILHGIQLLRMLRFDRQTLSQRRLTSEALDVDPLVWSNGRLQRWAVSVDLGEYAANLRESGVHGALAVLEPSFSADSMASALGIPASKNILRRHLTTEWHNLIQPARLSLESESAVSGKSRLSGSSVSLALAPAHARRTLDRTDRKRSSWRFSTWRSSQESLKSTSSKKSPATSSTVAERPRVLPLSPKLTATRHRRTFSSHSDVDALTVTPV